MRRRPLAGIRVCDLTHQAAGPWCTTLLGDMGADVVKVEKPGRGDGIRYAGDVPPEVGSYNFQGLNRNKRSCAIDLQTPRGRDLTARGGPRFRRDARRGRGGTVGAPMRGRAKRPIEHGRFRRPRIEAETVPPLPRTAASGQRFCSSRPG